MFIFLIYYFITVFQYVFNIFIIKLILIILFIDVINYIKSYKKTYNIYNLIKMQSLEQISIQIVFRNLFLIKNLPLYQQKKIINDYLFSENNKKTYSWIIKELNRIKNQHPFLECVTIEILTEIPPAKYYTYKQQGRNQQYNRNISNYTVIEAYSATEANEKAEKMGINIDPNQNLSGYDIPMYYHTDAFYSFWNIVSEEDGHFNEAENIDKPEKDSYFVHYLDGTMFRSREPQPSDYDAYMIYDLNIDFKFLTLPNFTIFNELIIIEID